MTYDEAMHFLAGLPNYEQQSPSARDMTLDPIRGLLDRLGNPHDRLFVVHVAGSKGKGSVSAMLERILRQAGYRTGLYTSPQLTSIEERIRVDGDAVAPHTLADLVSRAHAAVSGEGFRGPMPTHFDVMTALAFLHFESAGVDVAVIEVGMGGRTDSTNVCRPRLSVITSISYDHTRQLGTTLRAIGESKAGIIKPGVPTVSGVLPAEARGVIAAACAGRGSHLTQLHSDFTYQYTPGMVSRAAMTPAQVVVTTPARTWPAVRLNLFGGHQAANASVAVASVERLQQMGLTIADTAVVEALADVRWPARVEVVRRSPLVILDCAHNTASAEALVQTLRESFAECMERNRGRALLFGASWDKDLVGMLTILTPHFDRLYVTRYTTSARCATTDALAAAAAASGVKIPVVAVSDPHRAWELASSGAAPDDLICITGSVFLAGELRPSLVEL